MSLEQVVQLADYSFLLFKDALCPAFIARFTNQAPQPDRHLVEFAAPKFRRDGLRQGVVTVCPSDRDWIPLAKILSATHTHTAPVVWKRHLWGTPRDQKLLDLLQALPPLHEHVDVLSQLRQRRLKRTKRWIAGQGIKPWPISKTESDRPPVPLRWPLDRPFVDASQWSSDLFLLENETMRFKERLQKKKYRKDVLYSQPPEELFIHPLILISQGFGKVAYCDFDVLFQDSLQSIKGPAQDAELLMFLAVYLRSNLARYFLFHTAANWGSERDKVHFFKLLRIPFPLPGHEFISPDAEKIVARVARKVKNLRHELGKTVRQSTNEKHAIFDENGMPISKQRNRERKKRIDAIQKELEPLIYSYFGLSEQEIALLEDTNRISIPSSTPTAWGSEKIVTLDPIEHARTAPYDKECLAAYGKTLTGTLNSWAETEGSQFRVCAQGGTDDRTGLAMVTLALCREENGFQHVPLSRNLTEILKQWCIHCATDQGTLVSKRDILLFEEDHIHIVRPHNLMYWTRTAALNDAACIYGDIALSREAS